MLCVMGIASSVISSEDWKCTRIERVLNFYLCVKDLLLFCQSRVNSLSSSSLGIDCLGKGLYSFWSWIGKLEERYSFSLVALIPKSVKRDVLVSVLSLPLICLGIWKTRRFEYLKSWKMPIKQSDNLTTWWWWQTRQDRQLIPHDSMLSP